LNNTIEGSNSNASNEPIVYLNGQYLPLSQAHISVLDRGFIFGDGVYEVIPVYAKKTFRLHHHLQRLSNSLNAIQLSNPMDNEQWQQLISAIINKNHYDDQSVYLQVTRGVAQRDHSFPKKQQPTVFVMCSVLEPAGNTLGNSGISAITLDDIRWKNCHIKSISLLANVLLRQEALNQGAKEAILINNGYATEGAASNLFIIQQNCLITPPKGPRLLPGITRDVVVEIAHDKNLCVKEQDISFDELLQAQEIWLTSSSKEVMPVTKLNNNMIADGLPGPHWQTMIQAYQDYKQQLRTTL